MAVLSVHGVLCVLGTAFVILPHFNLGLLSDYKICGDSACESMISSAQAIRDHQGKDCRFLSFRRGDTIFVYHKLTGRRKDLWAGSIDKQFGYFPKDAVHEEQVFAAMEKVVETRKSDFFCMDEFGYPTDSTHLDSDDDDAVDDESDTDIPIHKSEFTQTTAQTESSLESAGPGPTESTVSAKEAEENEGKNNADPAEDTRNTASLDEQGGSPSSAWLSSSVTGWLGLTKEELPDHSAEEQNEDENKDTQAKDSLASSVTSWLTLGREGKPENAKESEGAGEETADSVTSSIGGWLGFSSEEKTDSTNEENEEPVETFRSRRISLDLEGSQFHAEEEKDTGTFGWLRNGLTSTLGLDSSNTESSYDKSVEEADKDEKEPSSNSWLEIGGILGFKKENTGDENDGAENGLKENRNDEDTARLENVVTSQSQPALTDDVKIDQSNLEQPLEDQNAHTNVQNGDKEIKEDESFKMNGQNKNKEVISVETRDEDHEQNNETMEQKQQEIQIPIGSNQDSTNQDDIYLSPDHTFRSSIDEDKAEDEMDPVSVETGSDGDYHKGAESIEEATLSHKQIPSTEAEELADESRVSSEQSQLSFFFSSEKSSDPVQAGNSSFTSHGEATNEDDTDTEAVIDISVETETSYVGLAQKKETPSTEGGSQEFTLLNFTRSNTESLMENSTEEEEEEQIPFDGSTPNTKSDIEGRKDTSEGGRQELMNQEENIKLEDSMQVEEIKEEVNQEEVEQLEDEERSDKPDESREVEEIKEVDKVEELVDEEGNVKVEDLLMAEEIKKEKPEEVKVSEDREENEQLLDIKEVEEIKEERQQEVERLDEKVKQHERGDVSEEAIFEEIKEKENKEEDKNIKEQIILLDPNEENKYKDVTEQTQEHENVALTESKEEKTVGEMELVKEQEKADEDTLKEVDGLQELAKEETGEKQVQCSQFEVQNNQSDSSTLASDSIEETLQDESFTSSFTESSTKIESPQSEEKWEDEDKKREEVAEVEQAEEQHVEGDNLKCSNELCTEGSADEFVVEEGSTEVVGISASEQSNHTNTTSERELIHSAGETTGQTKYTQELGTMEGKVEEEIREEVNQEELEQSEDEERSDKPEDLRAVEEINQVEKQDKVEELVDEEDLMMVEVKEKTNPEEMKVLEADEENEQLEDLKGAEEINEERQQEVEGFYESKKPHERDGVKEQTLHEEIKKEENKEEDETIKEQNTEEENKDSNKNEESDSWNEEKQGISASTSDREQSTSLGSSLTADDLSRDAGDSETVGAFGLFKNAFGFFSQTPTTEIIDSTEQAQTPNLNVLDPSELPPSLTHKQDLDSAGESSQNQDEPVESFTERPQSSTDLHTPSPNPEAPQQSKVLFKHYKNLLAHVDAEEMTILLDLFGQHKLQFLDYIISSSEAEDPDGDQSIVSDIERLLEHHREKLVTPSMRIAEAPQEDKGRTRTLVALQKLEVMLESVRRSFHAGQSDVSIHQAEVSCVDASCFPGEESRNTHDPSGNVDNIMHKDEFVVAEGDDGQDREPVVDKTEANRADIHSQAQQLQEGGMNHFLDFIRQMAEDSVSYSRAVMELITQVVSALPDDIRPGPDLYGVPWEPVIFTAVVGLVTVLLFTCRCYSSVKSRMYRSRERWLAQQVAQLLDEKCKVLETLSQHQQGYDDLENSLKDSGVLAQSQKTEQLEATAEHLAHTKRELERDLQQLKDQLDQQREHRTEQEKQIAALEENMETLEEEIKDLQSQDEQAQTTVKVYNMNSDRLERNLDTAGEENALLQESNAQLKQQVEGWAERVSELEAEMRRCEVAHSGMLQDVANKDERIKSLTDRLLSMKAWDSELEEEETETTNGTGGKGDTNDSGDTQGHRQKVQKLIYAAKLNADLKSVDEDKDRVFAKLNDEVKAKEDLQVAMKELENEKLSLQSDTEHYSEQVQRLQQKLHIMTEMYQENELKLHRLLTVEEKERLQKEEKLNKADKNIAMAMEELNNYRQRAGEMEEELEKTKQSYQTQISAHEKKAHNNWLAARAADRDLTDIRRENAILRQKLTDTQFKLDALDKDPYALDSLARPLPFRGERSPYGPSPLGRPASETRPFLSPPTLMEGPPPRLSPRVPRGPGEPPGGQGEMERSGGPHSDSGSISPTWDRRGPPPGPPGPLGPPGYMFRRPPPHPGAMGLLPPPGPLPPRGFPPGPPHPADLTDGPYRENSLGAAEQEHREQSGHGERKTPPESDPRMGGPPPPGPPMGPIDGPFPRRPPYGPPPPSDFYPPRGPGVPPIMPTWAPPPPGMMLPPRFPPHPHVPPYGAPIRHPPPPDGLPPHPMGLPPPRQSLPPPQDNPTSPEEAI